MALVKLLHVMIWMSLSATSVAVCTCLITFKNETDTLFQDANFVTSQCINGTCVINNDTALKIRSGSLILFSPGDYVLKSLLNFTNMSDVTFKGSAVMVTNSTGGRKYRPNSADGVITFEMSKTVLWCNSSGGGLTFSNINNLSLINLTFLSCGNGMRVAALQLTNITTLYMSGVAILNSSLMGLYGYAVTGHSWIMNSFFVGGYSGVILQRSTVTIASVTFGDCNKGIQYGCNTSISCKFVFDQTGVDSTDTDDLLTTSDATLGVSASTKATSESMLTVADSTFLYCEYGMDLILSKVFVNNCTFSANVFGAKVVDSFFTSTDTQYRNNSVGILAVNATVELENAQFLGGATHCACAVSSKLSITGNTSFEYCRTYGNGGALFLSRSVVYFVAPAAVTFSNSVAALGGAVYVEPWIKLFTKEECFFQINDSIGTIGNPAVRLYFFNNHGHKGGGAIYADVRYCTLDNTAGMNYGLTESELVLSNISSGIPFNHNATTRFISYESTKVCFCENGSIASCKQTVELIVYPGQKVNVSVASIDLYYQIVPSVIFLGNEKNAFIDYYLANLNFACDDFTLPREATYGLSNTTLSINTDATLSIQEGILPVSSIRLRKLPCPIGFNLTDNICNCTSFLANKSITCDIDSVSFTKPGDSLEVSWLGTSNTDDSIMLFSSLCPFDYCKATNPVRRDMLDEQCNFNRSGVMCGSCTENQSVIFGESECRLCNNDNISLLVAFAILGVVLVAFHFLLDITVTSGTITGLIFYANVVSMDSTLFFPPNVTNAPYGKFLYIFISWMNLDFGFDFCFFNGMQAYHKTWLQFVFTAYVMLIVVTIILVGRYCSRWALLRNSNVVPVLATLILLSFTRTLNSVVNIFQYSDVYDVSSGTAKRVWMYDGKIPFIGKMHVPLLTIAIAICVVFIAPYTLVMLFSSCLQRASHLHVLCWVNRLKPFIDCYQAPYKDGSRFWTGILLSTRIILSITAISTEVDKTTTAFIITLTSLLLLVVFLGLGIYKRWQLNVIEGFLYVNLSFMGLVVLYSEASRKEAKFNVNDLVIANVTIGVGSAFLCFAGVVIYHTYSRIRKALHRSATISTMKELKDLRLQEIDAVIDLLEPLNVEMDK